MSEETDRDEMEASIVEAAKRHGDYMLLLRMAKLKQEPIGGIIKKRREELFRALEGITSTDTADDGRGGTTYSRGTFGTPSKNPSTTGFGGSG